MAVCYLVHLDQRLGSDNPRGGARHYLGTTTRDLSVRLAEHQEGKGAKLLAAAVERGISFNVVRVWEGGRDVERQLKARRNAPALCPTCTGVTA